MTAHCSDGLVIRSLDNHSTKIWELWQLDKCSMPGPFGDNIWGRILLQPRLRYWSFDAGDRNMVADLNPHLYFTITMAGCDLLLKLNFLKILRSVYGLRNIQLSSNHILIFLISYKSDTIAIFCLNEKSAPVNWQHKSYGHLKNCLCYFCILQWAVELCVASVWCVTLNKCEHLCLNKLEIINFILC